MKIIYVYSDTASEWNRSERRCAIPARAINRTLRHHAELISIPEFESHAPAAVAACQAADVIVVQRHLVGAVLSAIQHWKASGKIILADFDDVYNFNPPTIPIHRYWIRKLVRNPDQNIPVARTDPPPLSQFKWGLSLVHAATVPSKRLASDWQAYAETIYLPNYIELSTYQNTLRESHQDIIIGWSGSLSHLRSFNDSQVIQALRRVSQARPRVKVMICGCDQDMFNVLSLPAKQKIWHPWVPYRDWPRLLSRFDIGIAPLHGPYDERRSWVKVLEYMVMKIPWIASDGPAYHDLRSYGWLANNSASAWERLLFDMIDHLDDYRHNAAKEPYLFGLAQGIDDNVERILDTYNKVYDKSS
jgi:glycosyltransferase involved in cell wall biosynthesis